MNDVDRQAHELSDILLRRFNAHRPTRDHAGLAAVLAARGEPSPPLPEGLRPAEATPDRVAVVEGFVRGYFGRPGERAGDAAVAASNVLFGRAAAEPVPVPAVDRPAASKPPVKRKKAEAPK